MKIWHFETGMFWDSGLCWDVVIYEKKKSHLVKFSKKKLFFLHFFVFFDIFFEKHEKFWFWYNLGPKMANIQLFKNLKQNLIFDPKSQKYAFFALILLQMHSKTWFLSFLCILGQFSWKTWKISILIHFWPKNAPYSTYLKCPKIPPKCLFCSTFC